MSRFVLTRQALRPAPLEDARAGALVAFEGRARGKSGGREVLRLEYEACEELAVPEGERILAEARERFEILDAACSHRVGVLDIGDVAVRIDVIAGHRRAAFEACSWIIDEVKRRVPLWKKEHFADGSSEWVMGEHSPAADAAPSQGPGTVVPGARGG